MTERGVSHPLSCRDTRERCGRRQRVNDVVPMTAEPAQRGQTEGIGRSEPADLQPARVPQPDQPSVRTPFPAGRAADDDIDLMALVREVPRKVVQVALAATTDIWPAERMDEGDAHGITGRARAAYHRKARRGTTRSSFATPRRATSLLRSRRHRAL